MFAREASATVPGLQTGPRSTFTGLQWVSPTLGALSRLGLRPWARHGVGKLLVVVRIRICILVFIRIRIRIRMCTELLRRAAGACIRPGELWVFRSMESAG